MNTAAGKLHLHNSLSGKKELFAPIDPGHVRLYACGPTVYNYAHIGNARMAVIFDLLARVLRRLYPKVTYVSNITDVDDKIMTAAQETGQPITTITRRFEDIYNADMAALGADKPDIQPRATEHIPQMVALCEKLIAAGHAYSAEGHVMFHVPSFPAYGSLSRRSRDEQVAGARVDIAPYKKDPADFVLWKPSTREQPGWDSPWGRGRPGWHIECSAMAEQHLGLPFDIHGGGADLKFPHHENEIAQSCCAHGHENDLTQFAKYWVHNGFVTVSGEKMSKSIGNVRLVHDLLQHYDGQTLRLALLSGHYRQPLDFNADLLAQTRETLTRFYRILYDLRSIDAVHSEDDLPPAIMDALCDDLNTPKAFAALSALASSGLEQQDLKRKLLAAGHLLGLFGENAASWLGFGKSEQDGNITELVQQRQDARKAKNFARADEIRKELLEMGIEVEDTPAGPQWRKIK